MFFVINTPEFIHCAEHTLRSYHKPEIHIPLDIELTVEDDRDLYDNERGYGFFVQEYLEWMYDFDSDVSRRRARLNDDTFADMGDPVMRARLISFTNEYYERWRDNEVTYPDESVAREAVRNTLCHDCADPDAWEDVYDDYDGDTADQVSDDEDPRELGLTIEMRMEILQRNGLRRERRDDLETAQQDAEDTVIRRDFTCRNDCDAFCERVTEVEQNQCDAKTGWLIRKWNLLWGKEPRPHTYIPNVLDSGSFHPLLGMRSVAPTQMIDRTVPERIGGLNYWMFHDPALNSQLHDMVTRVPLRGINEQQFRSEMLNEVFTLAIQDAPRALDPRRNANNIGPEHWSGAQLRNYVDRAYQNFMERQTLRGLPMLQQPVSPHTLRQLGVTGWTFTDEAVAPRHDDARDALTLTIDWAGQLPSISIALTTAPEEGAGNAGTAGITP